AVRDGQAPPGAVAGRGDHGVPDVGRLGDERDPEELTEDDVERVSPLPVPAARLPDRQHPVRREPCAERSASTGAGKMTTVLGRSLIFNIVGKAASLLLGLAAAVALARAVGPSGRGLLGVMFSVMELVTAIVGLGLPSAVLYFAARKRESLRPL